MKENTENILSYKTDVNDSQKQLIRNSIAKWIRNNKRVCISNDKAELIINKIYLNSGVIK